MQAVLEHLGVAVAAITGVLAARGKSVDLFGVLVLAWVASFGGGTTRDLLLGDTPVFWAKDDSFVVTATLAAMATFFIGRVRKLPRAVLLVADAFSLAFFTMLGVRKALLYGVAPHIAVAMGVITGVAGGILRDVLVGEIPLVFRRQIYLYATAAIIGATVYAMLDRTFPRQDWNLPIAAAVTLALRLIGIRWRLGLPLFDERE